MPPSVPAQAVIERERRGDYLGKTVQVVPHITDAIQDWIQRVAALPVDGRPGTPCSATRSVLVLGLGRHECHCGLVSATGSCMRQRAAQPLECTCTQHSAGLLAAGSPC